LGSLLRLVNTPITAPLVSLAAFTFRVIGVGSSPLVLTDVALKGQDPTSTTAYPRWSDVDTNARVDLKDVVRVLLSWYHGNYNETYDLNDDGQIDITDVVIVTSDFGKMDTSSDWGVTNTIYDILATTQDSSVTTYPDTMPPTTTIHLEGIQSSPPWFMSDITVSLDATDSGSGVAETDYSLDGITWFTYASPFVIMNEGTTTVYYYSTDNAGNAEPIRTEPIFIDKAPPVITINSPQAREYLSDEMLTVEFSASDTVSGLSSVQGALGLDPPTIYIDPPYETAGVGEPFSVDIRIADATELYAWQVRLKWNPLILNFVSVSQGEFLTRTGGTTIFVGPFVNLDEGWVVFGCALIEPADPVSGSGTLATVNFMGADIGSGTFEIATTEPYRTSLFDRNGVEIAYVPVNGFFDIGPPPEHLIVITSFGTSSTCVMTGEPVEIIVTVANQGASPETFDVTVSYDSTQIATQPDVYLEPGTSTPLIFQWDTTDVPLGMYIITVQAGDTTFYGGPISIMIPVTNGQQIDLSTLRLANYTLLVKARDIAGNMAESAVFFSIVQNTPLGYGVVVELPEGVSLSYDEVAAGGNTHVTTSDAGPAPPEGFKLGEPPTYYEIATTATYSGTIHVKILYDETQFADETSLRLLHWDENAQAWIDVTTSLDTVQNIIYGDVPSLSLFAVVEPACGTVSGTVTNEYTKQPIEGVTITILETGASTTTNSQGIYQFTDVPAGSYTVEMTVPLGYLTHEATAKSAEVYSGQDAAISFTVYQSSWSTGKEPRTIGYWKNWDNHFAQSVVEKLSAKNAFDAANQMPDDLYSTTAMESFVDDVKASSDLFNDLTVNNLKSYLTITPSTNMKQKAEVQLLASWLNVVSGKLGVDVQVNTTKITGWQMVINDADGILSVNDLLKQVDNYYLSGATLTDQKWEIIKNILDGLNNGKLFIP
jgi:hypothetical protein